MQSKQHASDLPFLTPDHPPMDLSGSAEPGKTTCNPHRHECQHLLNIVGGWQTLADANTDSMVDPDLVFEGQVLQLPA